MVKVKNMDIEEAVKLYDELQKRKDVVNLHFSRMMAEMDNRARMKYAVEKAEKRALRKGTEEGRQVGKQEGKEEIIKNMLKQNIDENIIMKVAGVTKEKLDEIIYDSRVSWKYNMRN